MYMCICNIYIYIYDQKQICICLYFEMPIGWYNGECLTECTL